VVDKAAFRARKRAFLERLIRETEQGRVDGDIQPLLTKLNQLEWAYTTSSCSGRILVAETPSIAAYTKGKGFKQLAKWHHAVNPSDVEKAAALARGVPWLMVRGAIIHVAVDSARRARELLGIARAAGFKHSGVLTVRRDGIIVEINSDDRLDAPITGADIAKLVEAANAVLLAAKLRLALLAAYIEERYFGERGLVNAVKTAAKTYINRLA